MAASDLQNDKMGFGCMTSILAVFASIIFFIKGYAWIGWLCIIPTLFLNLISFLKYSKGIKRNREELSKQLENLKPKTGNFKAGQTFISSNQLTKIAVDEQAKRICIWAPENPDTSAALAGMAYETFEYDYSDILAVEMSEDGVSLGTKSSQSQTARSLLEGFISKADGTFIGGAQPTEKKKKNVDSLDLTIIVNSPARPLHTINFFTFISEGSQPPLKKGSPAYREHINRLRHWYMLLSFVMQESTEEDKPVHETVLNDILPDMDNMDTLSAMDELLEESKRRQQGG